MPNTEMQQRVTEREFGLWICVALVVGNTIGMGIFVLPSSLASFGWKAIWAWGLVVAGCLVLARCITHLARRFPGADSPYDYVRATLGELPAFVAVWSYWVSVWVTMAMLAVAVVGYLQASLPGLSEWPPMGLALALVWLLVAVNALGVRSGGAVQIVTTVLKLLPMLLVMAIGVTSLSSETGGAAQQVVVSPSGLVPVLAAGGIVLYAMLGFESAAMPAGRVRDPQRIVPLATMLGTVLVGVIYIVVCAVPLWVLDQSALGQSEAPFVLLIDQQFGQGSGRWIGLFVIISGVGALNGWTLLAGEMARSLAHQRVMPSMVAAENRFRAPWVGLLLVGLLASIVVLTNYSRGLVEVFSFLTVVITAASIPFYLFCTLALLRLAQREAAYRRVAIVALAVLGALFTLALLAGMGSEPFYLALVLAAAGLPLYFFKRWRLRRTAT